MCEYRDCYLAFIDILGFTERVRASDTNEEQFNEVLRGLTQLDLYNPGKTDSDDKGYLFSDNIAIVTKKDPTSLGRLVRRVHQIYGHLLSLKLMTRGAIVAGKLYWSESIIFGPALIEAIELEKKAKYPRIALQESVAQDIKSICAAGVLQQIAEGRNVVRQQEVVTEYYDLDLLNLTPTWGVGLSREGWLAGIQAFLIEERSKPQMDKEKLEKIEWFLHYVDGTLKILHA